MVNGQAFLIMNCQPHLAGNPIYHTETHARRSSVGLSPAQQTRNVSVTLK
jgi:hypothetical protein